jgi:hypothetical protein
MSSVFQELKTLFGRLCAKFCIGHISSAFGLYKRSSQRKVVLLSVRAPVVDLHVILGAGIIVERFYYIKSMVIGNAALDDLYHSLGMDTSLLYHASRPSLVL